MTEPASIRFNNPGAMWGRTGKRPSADKEVETNNPLALKWGSQRTFYLSDGLDQGNNIASFPTKVQGAAAQFDLWHTSKNYHNRNLADALHTWSGGNYTESYIAFVIKRVTGLTRFTNMNDDFLASQKGLVFMKAQAWHEAGQPYPMTDAEWTQAQALVFAGASPMPQPPPKPPITAPEIKVPPPGQVKPDLAPTFWGRLADLFKPKGQ